MSKRVVSKNHDNILDSKRYLSSNGDLIIDTCQTRLLMLKLELAGLSGLMRNMSGCDFSPEEFMGIGLSLERFGKRLDRVSSKLALVTTIKSESNYDR